MNKLVSGAVMAAALFSTTAQAAPVAVLSMQVTGVVSSLEFSPHTIVGPDGLYTNIYSPDQPLSYYGKSDGFFTTDVGGAVSGQLTLFEDSVTSHLSLDCALAQYSFNMCGGTEVYGPFTDADGNMNILSIESNYFTRIVRTGEARLSMVFQHDGGEEGTTVDGLGWYNTGLRIAWDFTIVASPADAATHTSLITTPLPSSALLLFTPLAFVAWRRRAGRRGVSRE